MINQKFMLLVLLLLSGVMNAFSQKSGESAGFRFFRPDSNFVELGNEYLFENKIDQAHTFYLKGLEKYQEEGHEVSFTSCLVGLCNTFSYMGDNLEGSQMIDSLLRPLYSKVSGSDFQKEFGLTLSGLGLLYYSLGEFQQVKKIMKLGLSLLNELSDSALRVKAEILGSWGLIRLNMQELEPGKTLLDSALKILHSLPDSERTEIPGIYSYLGLYCLRTGNLDGYYNYANKSLKAAKTYYKEKDFRFAAIYHNLGTACAYRDKIEEALFYSEKARSIFEEVGDYNVEALASVYTTLYYIYKKRGEGEKQINCLHNAYKNMVKMRGEWGSGMELCYNNFANYFGELGDYTQGLQYHVKASKVLELQNGNYLLKAQNFENIGLCYLELNQPDSAFSFFEKTLSIRNSFLGIDHVDSYNTHFSIGKAYALTGDTKRAEWHFNIAMTGLRNVQNYFVNSAENYRLIGAMYCKGKSYDKGINYLRKGLALAQERNDPNPHVLYSIIFDLAKALSETEQKQESYELLTEALTRAKCLPSFSDPEHLDLQYWEQNPFLIPVLINIIRVRLDLAVSIGRIRQLTTQQINENLQFVKMGMALLTLLENRVGSQQALNRLYQEHRSLFENAIALLILLQDRDEQAFKPTQALLFSERYKANQLLEVLRTTDNQRWYGVPIEITNLENKLKGDFHYTEQKMLSFKQQNENNSANPFQNEIDKIRLRMDSLKHVMRERYPKYYKLHYDRTPVSIEEIRTEILQSRSDHAFLEFFEGDSAYYVIGVSQEDLVLLELGTNLDSLNAQLKTLRLGLEGKGTVDNRTLATLYQTLLSPVLEGKSGLRDGAALTKLTIIPDGRLRGIPFDVFLTEPVRAGHPYRDLPYAIKRYSFAYAFSGTVLAENIRQAIHLEDVSNQEIVAFSPDFSNSNTQNTLYETEGLSPLNATRDLIRDLQSTYNQVRIFENGEATESVFKQLREATTILHLNSHGFFREDLQDDSAILLSPDADSTEDGMLFTRELLQMKLLAEMAILNACNSGYGSDRPGEGLMSLSRGFAYAGVPSILVSLWEQRDESSAQILRHFYRFLASGMDKDEALRAAKLEYLKTADGFNSQPGLWAHFICMGATNPVVIQPAKSKIFTFIAVGFISLFLVGSVLYFRTQRRKN